MTTVTLTGALCNQANTDAFLALAREHAHEDFYAIHRSGHVTRISFPPPPTLRRTWRARCRDFSRTT